MRRGFAAAEGADDRDAERQGNALADEFGLIVSALEKTRPVQRDRDDHVDRTREFAPELVAEGRYATVAKFARVADAAAFAAVRYQNEPKSFLESLKSRDYLSFADSGAIYSGREMK